MRISSNIVYLIAIASALGSFFLISSDLLWLRVLLVIFSFIVIIFSGIRKSQGVNESVTTSNSKFTKVYSVTIGAVAIILVLLGWFGYI